MNFRFQPESLRLIMAKKEIFFLIPRSFAVSLKYKRMNGLDLGSFRTDLMSKHKMENLLDLPTLVFQVQKI